MLLKAIIHSSKYINLRKFTTMLRKKSSGMKKTVANLRRLAVANPRRKKAKLRKFATLKAAINNISRARGEHQKEYTDK